MNKPQIRFKGFEDEWSPKSLSEPEFEIQAGGDIDKSILKSSGHYPVIANALAGEGILGYYDNLFRIKAPAVSITGRGDVGVAVPRRMNFTPVVRLLALTSPNDIDFLSCAINLHPKVLESTGVPQLTVPKLQSYCIFFPKLVEQKVIGNFFKQINDMMAEAEREVSRLEKMKQASLQKMFPRPGATAPEIRFDGFSEPWIVRSVGSCFAEGVERGGFDNLLSVGITRGVYPTEVFIKTVTVKDFSNYKTVHNHDIVYNSMRMWQGASGVSYFCGIVSPAYTVLTPRENVWSPFFAYLFKLPWVIKIFEANSQGLTKDTWNLKYPAISIIEFAVPSDIKEQIHIADYFSRLDDLLNAKRQKLAKLRNIKQACLDKMFVNTSEL